MKNLILVFSLILLVSCGKPVNETLERVHSDFRSLDILLLQAPENAVNTAFKVGDKDSSEEVEELETTVNEEVERLNDLIDDLHKLVDDLEIDQDILQDDISDLKRRLVDLETNQTTTLVFDPCGDLEGEFDQTILIVEVDGVKSFYSQDKKGKAKKLNDGTYRTKDRQKCTFIIDNGSILD